MGRKSRRYILFNINNMDTLQLSKFDAPGAIESVKIKVAPFAGLTISGLEDKA